MHSSEHMDRSKLLTVQQVPPAKESQSKLRKKLISKPATTTRVKHLQVCPIIFIGYLDLPSSCFGFCLCSLAFLCNLARRSPKMFRENSATSAQRQTCKISSCLWLSWFLNPEKSLRVRAQNWPQITRWLDILRDKSPESPQIICHVF